MPRLFYISTKPFSFSFFLSYQNELMEYFVLRKHILIIKQKMMLKNAEVSSLLYVQILNYENVLAVDFRFDQTGVFMLFATNFCKIEI